MCPGRASWFPSDTCATSTALSVNGSTTLSSGCQFGRPPLSLTCHFWFVRKSCGFCLENMSRTQLVLTAPLATPGLSHHLLPALLQGPANQPLALLCPPCVMGMKWYCLVSMSRHVTPHSAQNLQAGLLHTYRSQDPCDDLQGHRWPGLLFFPCPHPSLSFSFTLTLWCHSHCLYSCFASRFPPLCCSCVRLSPAVCPALSNITFTATSAQTTTLKVMPHYPPLHSILFLCSVLKIIHIILKCTIKYTLLCCL